MVEPYVYVPTEPIPAETGTPLTYEQGERLIQALEGLKVDVATNQEVNSQGLTNIQLLLDSIKENTVPLPIDAVTNPSGIAMTFEQGQKLIQYFDTLQHLAFVVVIAVALVFVSKFVYRVIGGIFFGGL